MITKEAVDSGVKELIAHQLGISEDQVTPEVRLTEDLGSDSLDAVELMMALDNEFGINLPYDMVEGAKTVQQVIDLVYTQATE